jgi:hypothetical protein
MMMMMMMMIIIIIPILLDFENSALRLPSMLYLSTYLLIFMQYSFNI